MGAFPENNTRELIERTNRAIPLTWVLRRVGIDVGNDIPDGGSIRTSCPEGALHRDGGMDPALRVYQSNTGWCFDCSTFWTPVKLWATVKGINHREAALDLLSLTGNASLIPDHDWRELLKPEERPKPDKAELLTALRLFAGRLDPIWSETVEGSRALSRCATLLNSVHSDEDARKWLVGCREFLTRTVALNHQAVL